MQLSTLQEADPTAGALEASPLMLHEEQANVPPEDSAGLRQTDDRNYGKHSQTATITVAVKGAASGETILEPHEFFRINLLWELKRVLAIVKSNEPDEEGRKPTTLAACYQHRAEQRRNGKNGGYQITILHNDREVQDHATFHENQVELATIFHTKYQIGDHFQGFEFECPGANDKIPYWAPGRQHSSGRRSQ